MTRLLVCVNWKNSKHAECLLDQMLCKTKQATSACISEEVSAYLDLLYLKGNTHLKENHQHIVLFQKYLPAAEFTLFGPHVDS